MHAVGITDKTLDLIATNNGGLQPAVEPSPYPNCAGTYFILPTNPNDHAEIVSVDDFFNNYEFIGPESETEFRPIRPILQFVRNVEYRISRDLLSRMVAAHISGKFNADPDQLDCDIADEMIALLETKLSRKSQETQGS